MYTHFILYKEDFQFKGVFRAMIMSIRGLKDQYCHNLFIDKKSDNDNFGKC